MVLSRLRGDDEVGVLQALDEQYLNHLLRRSCEPRYEEDNDSPDFRLYRSAKYLAGIELLTLFPDEEFDSEVARNGSLVAEINRRVPPSEWCAIIDVIDWTSQPRVTAVANWLSRTVANMPVPAADLARDDYPTATYTSDQVVLSFQFVPRPHGGRVYSDDHLIVAGPTVAGFPRSTRRLRRNISHKVGGAYDHRDRPFAVAVAVRDSDGLSWPHLDGLGSSGDRNTRPWKCCNDPDSSSGWGQTRPSGSRYATTFLARKILWTPFMATMRSPSLWVIPVRPARSDAVTEPSASTERTPREQTAGSVASSRWCEAGRLNLTRHLSCSASTTRLRSSPSRTTSSCLTSISSLARTPPCPSMPRARSRSNTGVAASRTTSHSTTSPAGCRAAAGSTITWVAPEWPLRTSTTDCVRSAGVMMRRCSMVTDPGTPRRASIAAGPTDHWFVGHEVPHTAPWAGARPYRSALGGVD